MAKFPYRTELVEYVNLKVPRTDMMQFWFDLRIQFPKLYAVVRRVLCIPAISTSQNAF